MGVFAGPDVSESGLVLALDAGNNKSYSTNKFISYGSGSITENVTFSVQGTGVFQRVGSGTVIGGYTVKPNDVVYSYALGGNGCHYHGNDVFIPAGVSATFSFDYLVTGATTYPIIDYLANFEIALSGAVATANNLQNVWQRRTFTAGPTSGGTLRMLLYPGACSSSRLADSGTIYYKNPKVEFTNVDTGDGNFSSMSNLTTWYDLNNRTNNGTLTNGPYHLINTNATGGSLVFDGGDDYVTNGALPGSFSSFTVIIWFYPTSVTNYENPIDCNYSYNGSTGNIGPRLEMNDSGTLAWNYSNNTGDNGSFYSHSVLSSGLSANTWHYAAITYNGGTNTSTTYYNGNATGLSRTTIGSPTGFIGVMNNVNIGRGFHLGGAERPFTGRVSNVQIYNRALTASEIQQNFNAIRSRFGI